MRKTVLALLLACCATSASAEVLAFDCVAEPARRVEIGSSVTGLLAEVLVDRGARVSRGDLLARMESDVEEANVALAAAQAEAREALEAQKTRLALAESALDRARQLVNSGSATRTRVEELEAAVEIARRDLETEQHRIRVAAIELERQEALLKRLSIVSPLDGVVTNVMLQAGEFVRQDSPVMTLVQTDPLHIETYMPAELWDRIKIGLQATVSLEQPQASEYQAPVTVVDPVFDAASGTFGVRLELENPGGALPAGQRCRVAVELPNG